MTAPLGRRLLAEFMPVHFFAQPVVTLMGLGIAEPAARRVVESAAIRLGEEAEPGAIIKAALQELGR